MACQWRWCESRVSSKQRLFSFYRMYNLLTFLYYRTKTVTFVHHWHHLIGMNVIRICWAPPALTLLVQFGDWKLVKLLEELVYYPAMSKHSWLPMTRKCMTLPLVMLVGEGIFLPLLVPMGRCECLTYDISNTPLSSTKIHSIFHCCVLLGVNKILTI